MKHQEFNNKNIEELQETLKQQKVSLGKLRFNLNSNVVKDSSKFKKTKKDIARIMTAINKNRK